MRQHRALGLAGRARGVDDGCQVVRPDRVSYRLDSGPNGMTISKDGKLTWKVPNDWAEVETDVIVGVTDSTGQECLHTFTIKIDG